MSTNEQNSAENLSAGSLGGGAFTMKFNSSQNPKDVTEVAADVLVEASGVSSD
jgi:hypothetical protein